MHSGANEGPAYPVTARERTLQPPSVALLAKIPVDQREGLCTLQCEPSRLIRWRNVDNRHAGQAVKASLGSKTRQVDARTCSAATRTSNQRTIPPK